jgi:hypothetical protein
MKSRDLRNSPVKAGVRRIRDVLGYKLANCVRHASDRGLPNITHRQLAADSLNGVLERLKGARYCARSIGGLNCTPNRSRTTDAKSRDGQAQRFHRRDERERLLLRSSQPAAARHEREHEPVLRQYFPHGTDLSHYSQLDLDKIALRLNQRPRETLGFKTPAYRLQASVAPTH